MPESTWSCVRGAMDKKQARGMRHRDNKDCKDCKTCCGPTMSTSKHVAVTAACTVACNDHDNCPGKPSRRVVPVQSKKSVQGNVSL